MINFPEEALKFIYLVNYCSRLFFLYSVISFCRVFLIVGVVRGWPSIRYHIINFKLSYLSYNNFLRIICLISPVVTQKFHHFRNDIVYSISPITYSSPMRLYCFFPSVYGHSLKYCFHLSINSSLFRFYSKLKCHLQCFHIFLYSSYFPFHFCFRISLHLCIFYSKTTTTTTTKTYYFFVHWTILFLICIVLYNYWIFSAFLSFLPHIFFNSRI